MVRIEGNDKSKVRGNCCGSLLSEEEEEEEEDRVLTVPVDDLVVMVAATGDKGRVPIRNCCRRYSSLCKFESENKNSNC